MNAIKNIRKRIRRIKHKMSVTAGAWNAASRSRPSTRYLSANSGDADENARYELEDMRNHCGDLVRNYPMAAGIANRKRNSIVGPGIWLQPTVDHEALGITEAKAKVLSKKLLAEWRLWANGLGTCDLERQVDIAGYQRLLLDSRLERGDVFTVFVHKHRIGCPYRLRLQLIEADQISNPDNQPDSLRMRGGIERSADGEVVAMHFRQQHPGNTASAGKRSWQRIPMYSSSGSRRWLQFIDKRRRGQSRGIPDLAPIVEGLAQLTKFSGAYLHKALVSAFFTFAYKGEDLDNPLNGVGTSVDGGRDLGGSGPEMRKLGMGTGIELGVEEEIVLLESKTPSAEFTPYFDGVAKTLSAAVNVPPELLFLLFSTSFTAAQAAFIAYWQYVEVERDLMGGQLDEIYKAFVSDIVELGRIDLPGYDTKLSQTQAAYLKCRWVSPPRGQLKPEAQNKADILAEDRGWKTPEQNAAERGNDLVKPIKEVDNA